MRSASAPGAMRSLRFASTSEQNGSTHSTASMANEDSSDKGTSAKRMHDDSENAANV